MIEDVVWEVHQLLDDLGIRHAFGGALALNYYATPRATVDVDINIAVDFHEADPLVAKFERVDFRPMLDRSQWMPSGGVRLLRDVAIVDLFFAFDDYHRIVLDNASLLPMLLPSGNQFEVPIMAADDLVVFKASFNRAKDWVDIGAMIDSGTPIDADYVTEHLVALRGPTAYPRAARIQKMLSQGPT